MTEQVSKKRGRPVTGPVPVYFMAINWDNKIKEKIYTPIGLSKEEINDFSEEDIKSIFLKKYGFSADEVDGPSYDKKGTKSKKDSVVSASVSEISNLASSLGSVVHDNWKGIAFPIEGNDEIVFFLPLEDLTKNPNRCKPGAQSIAKSAIQFTN